MVVIHTAEGRSAAQMAVKEVEANECKMHVGSRVVRTWPSNVGDERKETVRMVYLVHLV